MPTCPQCLSDERQNRAGQRQRGCFCQRKYTPEPKLQGCAPAVRRRAVQWYVDGMNLRRIGRHLGVHHQSVANWVKAQAEQLPPAPVPASVETAELDELFTFVESKKHALHRDESGSGHALFYWLPRGLGTDQPGIAARGRPGPAGPAVFR